MHNGKLLVAVACGALFVVGCKKQNNNTAPEGATSTEQLQKSAENAAENAKDTAKSAADNMKDMAHNAKEKASDAADAAKEKASDAAEKASDAAASSALVQNATEQLDQLKGYIKDHKYELADKTLDQLEAHKSALPESIQTQLPALRKQVDALKSQAGQ